MSNRTDAGHKAGKQNYATPADFMSAVHSRFGIPAFDLAASAENTKAPSFFSEEDDALTKDWRVLRSDGHMWLNPPYRNIKVWANRCALAGSKILFLVPASIGSEWYATWVHPFANTIALRGRITFEGCTTPFPKDCILADYGGPAGGFEVWDWRKLATK